MAYLLTTILGTTGTCQTALTQAHDRNWSNVAMMVMDCLSFHSFVQKFGLFSLELIREITSMNDIAVTVDSGKWLVRLDNVNNPVF